MFALLGALSDFHEHERDSSPETFPDWLDQIEGEYLHLTELYEKEREHGQKLADLMAQVLHEVGFAIPLNPIVLSAAIPNVTEAQLEEGAVVSYVDSSGNRGTRPLTLMPLETIIFTVHECTFRLKEMVSERRRLMARRVRVLERVNFELDRAHEVLRSSEPDSEPELETVGDASGGLPDANLALDTVQETKRPSEPDSEPEPGKIEVASAGLPDANLALDTVQETKRPSEPDSEPEPGKIEVASAGLPDANLALDTVQETKRPSEPDSEPEPGKIEVASAGLPDANLALDTVQETKRPSEPDSEPEPGKIEVASGALAVSALPDLRSSSGLADLTESREETSEPVEEVVEGFKFKGSFKDKLHALDKEEWGPE